MASGRSHAAHQAETFKAAGDLSLKRYHFMKLSAANTVTTAGAGERAIGVLQVPGDAAGKSATVALVGGGGGTKLVVGAAVLFGALLKSDTNGRAVTASGTEAFYAIANEAGGNDGEVIEAYFQTGIA